ncbi:MAG TPA: PQQ-binding-like beta-propeller repeat protein [Fimbriiglobus sp.]|nr:PQQ-binding-like beta-propeller repeat protein [Fimbriiglobus sp.]
MYRPTLFIAFLLAGYTAPADDAPKPGAAERTKPTRKGSDWPRFLGPNGDGTSPETGILTTWPKEGLKKVWECKLGAGYAPPAVAAGKLYHFDRYGDAARLTCRNAETGEIVWKYECPTRYEDYYGYDNGPRACPVVDGDRVYIHGVDGVLACVAAADGKELWKVDTRAKYHFHQNFFGVSCAPLVDGELLIVAVGGSPKGPRPADLREAKGDGTAIVAFDKKTGEEKYRLGDELASYSSPVVKEINGKRVGLYFARGGLLGFDPRAGKQLFHYKWRSRMLESVNAANPVIVGDKVLITECYEKGSALVKVSPGWKVEEVWTDAGRDHFEKALMAHWNTPVRDGGFVYASSGRHAPEGDLRCVELATGEVKWRERRTTRSMLTKIDGHVLSFAESGELRLFKLNPARYEEVARWEVPELTYPSWGMPVVSRGLLYLRGEDAEARGGHKLVCFELIPKR